MPETLRHKRWERTGRTFEVLDDLGQAIPNKFALTTRIGERNVDLGDGTFAPYVLAGATLKHGDSECEFADGWQTIRRLGQVLVSKSRLVIQRDISGVWTDVPHGIPTRNVAHDYPREGKCTAYLDFPDIQGYAQGARLQVGIEVGGSDKEIFGFRMRSPVAGTFRLEWVLEIPEDVDLSWIETPTSKTDPTPIRIGSRIGQTEIRWSNAEALFRSATVESDGAGGRILHLFIGPYTLAAQEWLTIYPDTLGPVSVAATGDDGHEYPQDTWVSTSAWMGHYGTSDLWTCTRFLGINITKGYSITSATYKITGHQTEGGTYTVNCRVKAQAIDSASAPSGTNLPSDFSYTTNYTDVSYSTTSWADVVKDIDVKDIVQELVNRSGWSSGNALNLVILNNGTTGNDDISIYDYGLDSAKTATLTIVYTAEGSATIEQEGFRFRNDDGSESAATWKANQDTNITLAADTAFRLRFLLKATGNPDSIDAQAEARIKPSGGAFGSWEKIN